MWYCYVTGLHANDSVIKDFVTKKGCYPCQILYFFFSFEVGNFKWGFYFMTPLTHEWNLEMSHFVVVVLVGILHCYRAIWLRNLSPMFYLAHFYSFLPTTQPSLLFLTWFKELPPTVLWGRFKVWIYCGCGIPWKTYDSYFVES